MAGEGEGDYEGREEVIFPVVSPPFIFRWQEQHPFSTLAMPPSFHYHYYYPSTNAIVCVSDRHTYTYIQKDRQPHAEGQHCGDIIYADHDDFISSSSQ